MGHGPFWGYFRGIDALGVDVVAPPSQYQPAVQGPSGLVCPGCSQYSPDGQSVHILALYSPVRLPKVPAGHGLGVPSGQKYPFLQGSTAVMLA